MIIIRSGVQGVKDLGAFIELGYNGQYSSHFTQVAILILFSTVFTFLEQSRNLVYLTKALIARITRNIVCKTVPY